MRKIVVIISILGAFLIALAAFAEQTPPAEPAGGPDKTPVKASIAPVKAVKAVKAQAKAVKALRKAGPPTKAAKTVQTSAPVEEQTEEPEAAEQTAATEESTEEEPAITAMPTNMAGFVDAMSKQITKVGGQPQCDDDKGQCHYWYRGNSGQNYEIQLWYNGTSRSIYIFVNQFASATENNAATPVVLRHLSAINRLLEISRFEWNAADGEIRLSTVMNVDTNFDRWALRNLLRLVQDTADRYQPEVTRLLADHENASEAPTLPANETRTVTDRHGYLDVIENVIRDMGFNPVCEEELGKCTFEYDSEEARNVFPVAVTYNSETNIITVATERYVSAPTNNPNTDRLLQRVTHLNWQQLVPIFQWNASDGNLRVAGALNTDTNLDRRALRGVIGSVNTVVARHYRELRGILNP